MGVVMDFEACFVGGSKPERAMPDDGIGVFLNWKRLEVSKYRANAIYLIEDLISKAPAEARKEFELYKDVLMRGLK
jgi:hypothetical protein